MRIEDENNKQEMHRANGKKVCIMVWISVPTDVQKIDSIDVDRIHNRKRFEEGLKELNEHSNVLTTGSLSNRVHRQHGTSDIDRPQTNFADQRSDRRPASAIVSNSIFLKRYA